MGQEPAADVAADVVADDDDGVEPEEIDIPLPGAEDVHDIGNGVVEATYDEQRDAEENGNQRLAAAVEPDGKINDKAAADGTEETAPGALRHMGRDSVIGTFGHTSTNGGDDEAHCHGTHDIPPPHLDNARNAGHDTSAPGIERNARENYADEAESKDDGAGKPAEGQETACTQADEDSGHDGLSVCEVHECVLVFQI